VNSIGTSREFTRIKKLRDPRRGIGLAALGF
jgi:hypothetical protein